MVIHFDIHLATFRLECVGVIETLGAIVCAGTSVIVKTDIVLFTHHRGFTIRSNVQIFVGILVRDNGGAGAFRRGDNIEKVIMTHMRNII